MSFFDTSEGFVTLSGKVHTEKIFTIRMTDPSKGNFIEFAKKLYNRRIIRRIYHFYEYFHSGYEKHKGRIQFFGRVLFGTIRVVVAIYPVFATVIFSIYNKTISKTFLYTIEVINEKGIIALINLEVEPITFVFFVSGNLWLLTTTIYFIVDDRRTRVHQTKLRNTIVRSPNSRIFDSYSNIILSLSTAIKDNNNDIKEYERIDQLATRIRGILFQALILTSIYFKYNKRRIGVNIMINIENNENNRDYIRKRKNEFLHHQKIDLDEVKSILELRKDLSMNFSGSNDFEYENLIIPYLHSFDEDFDPTPPTPGAAKAVQATNDIIPDTKKIHLLYDKFDERTIEESKAYFNDVGKKIKSFTCHSITIGGKSLGVISIDSRTTYMKEDFDGTYFKTFTALLSPIIVSLYPLVEEYIKIWSNNKQT